MSGQEAGTLYTLVTLLSSAIAAWLLLYRW